MLKAHMHKPPLTTLAMAAVTLVIAGCAAPANQRPQNSSPNEALATPTQNAMIEAERTESSKETARDKQERAEREKSVHLKLVEQMLEQDNAFAALAHLDAYDQKWGVSRRSKQLRGDSLRKTNQLDKAESVYQSLLSGTPTTKTGAVWYGLGKVSIEKGDLRTASARLEKSIQIDPLNTDAYSDLGLVYLLEGQKDPAYNSLMKASQLSGGDNRTLANLALWGLVFDDFNMSMKIADQLKWTDATRSKVMAQANTIKKRLETKGIN